MNKIEQTWNEENREDYIRAFQNQANKIKTSDNKSFPHHLIDHLDMIYRVNEQQPTPMTSYKITKEEVRDALNLLKPKKSPGLDNMKPELYRAMKNSKICVNVLTDCFNNLLDTGTIPDDWKLSRTRMIPKTRKPTVKDLRPIALTNYSYKIFMSILKSKLEKHIKNNNNFEETQSGFTSGRRTEDNLLVLQYCIEDCYIRKIPLVVTSIDFSKAFDSVKREELIHILTDNKVHPNLINIISKIYQGDKTVIEILPNQMKEIDISSGIKQGCTGSATLFKMLTYKIMEYIDNRSPGFHNHHFKISSLFFADDGLLLNHSIQEAEMSIEALTEIGKKYGLEINKGKSHVIIFNLDNYPESIRGIDTTTTIQYLGVTVNNSRNCFTTHKKKMLEKAEKMANLTYPVIHKSCNRLLIGKTYWKSVALPAILHGTSVINLNKNEVDSLQIIENKVYRQILGASNFAPVSTLRGEIGSSSMKARIMEAKIQYLRNATSNSSKTVETHNNELIYQIINKMKAYPDYKWIEEVNKYIRELNIRHREIKNMSKLTLKKIINKYDTECWKEEMAKKSTLTIYRRFKKEIKGEQDLYDNTPAATIMYRCRSNSLYLNIKKKHQGGNTKCPFCGEDETLQHFLLHCPNYSKERQELSSLQRPYIEDEEQIIGETLFGQHKEAAKKSIYKMWRRREKMMKTAENIVHTGNTASSSL